MKVKTVRQHNEVGQRCQESLEYVGEQLRLLRQEVNEGGSMNDERLHKIDLQLAWLGGFLQGAAMRGRLPWRDATNS